MATGKNIETEITTATEDAAVNTLFNLLRDNLSRAHYHNYELCHQERMVNINKVLQSDGGKHTVEELIKRIDSQREIVVKEASDAAAKNKEYRKKHPFKNFFSLDDNEHRKTYYNKVGFIQKMDTIKSELVAALNLANVIELSGMTNKPKIG